MRVENVILFNNWKCFESYPGKVDRIYYGSEFCGSLLPAPADIDRLVNFERKAKISFSIVTPYLNQRGMKRLFRLLTFIDKNCPGIEVVVNDWGSFQIIREQFPGLLIVLGRVLSRQKRAPFVKTESGIIQLEELGLSHADKMYLKSSILQNDYLMGFVRQCGIRRMGLDNMRQGLIFQHRWMKIDLYYPYVYITTTDYCRYRRRTGVVDKGDCPCSCRDVPVARKVLMGKEWVYTHGNTQFYLNETLPVGMPAQVDRIVKIVF